jgi:hypothetical protein
MKTDIVWTFLIVFLILSILCLIFCNYKIYNQKRDLTRRKILKITGIIFIICVLLLMILLFVDYSEEDDDNESSTNDMRVVVSLTTIPSRIDKIKKTIDSLILQKNINIDNIFVTIPYRFGRNENEEYEIPSWLQKYHDNENNVSILRIDRDMGPGTKLYGAAKKYRLQQKDTIHVILDDDYSYGKNHISNLVKQLRAQGSNSAVGYMGSIVVYNQKKDKFRHFQNLTSKITRVHMLCGHGGIAMYNSSIPDEWFTFVENAPIEAKKSDDVHISAFLRHNRTRLYSIPFLYKEPYTSWTLRTRSALSNIEALRNNNRIENYDVTFKTFPNIFKKEENQLLHKQHPFQYVISKFSF